MTHATGEVLVERAMVLLMCHTYNDLHFARDLVRTFGDHEQQQSMIMSGAAAPDGTKWRLSADMRGNSPANPELVIDGADLPDTVMLGMPGSDIDDYIGNEMLKGSGTIIRSVSRRGTSSDLQIRIDLEPCMITRPEAVMLIEEIARRRGKPLDCIIMHVWDMSDEMRNEKHSWPDVITMQRWEDCLTQDDDGIMVVKQGKRAAFR